MGRRRLIEAHDIPHHRPEARPDDVAFLGNQLTEAAAAILQPPPIQRNAERHIGRFGLDPEMIKQRNKVGISRLIVDDEAHIDRHRLPAVHDIDRVRMPAKPGFSLEERDICAF